jgi:protein-S-isoprenylcysteine O-methyltransferase Ste14
VVWISVAHRIAADELTAVGTDTFLTGGTIHDASRAAVIAGDGDVVWLARDRYTRTLAPAAAERTIYVWIASILFIAVCVWWQPVPGLLWSVEPPIGWLLAGVQVAGVVLTGLASRRLSVFALAGIRQAEGAPTGGALVADGSYAVVRHPIYLAWLLMVWPAPQLTATRAVFAALSSLYLMAAVPFEERALRRMFGERYATYAQRVRWRMIPFVY